MLAQNDVCFEIESNPDPFNPALNSFSKYVNVLDCIHIYAEAQSPPGAAYARLGGLDEETF